MPAILIVVFLLAGEPPEKWIIPMSDIAQCETFKTAWLRGFISLNGSRIGLACVEAEPAEPAGPAPSSGEAI